MASLALRLLSFAVPIGLAALALVYVASSRPPPEQTALGERARAVRVLPLEPVSFVPSVVGYASVDPVRTWDAVAQVQGRIAFVHPNLRVGAMLPAGTEIIRIAGEDYALAVREAEANLEAARAELRELEIRAENTDRSLDIERRSLEIKRADLIRQEGLLARGVTSQSAVDTVQRDVLQQQVAVQEQENAAALYPAEIETQKTQIAVAEARLASAKLDLGRTSIAMPFRGRIATKEVEATQFVTAGNRARLGRRHQRGRDRGPGAAGSVRQVRLAGGAAGVPSALRQGTVPGLGARRDRLDGHGGRAFGPVRRGVARPRPADLGHHRCDQPLGGRDRDRRRSL